MKNHNKTKSRICSKIICPGLILFFSVLLSACVVGPNYVRPGAVVPMQFKEGDRYWQPACPQDGCYRGAWWTVFHDPCLDVLESQVNISNQNIALAVAQYEQARALVDEARASYFPTLSASFAMTRQKSAMTAATTTTTTTDPTASVSGTDASSTIISGGGGNVRNRRGPFTSESLVLNAAWEPDLWGNVRRTVEANCAGAAASVAAVVLAQLSAQASLAQYYFELRGLDRDQKLLDDTVIDYQKALQITIHQYQAGTAGQSDIVQARSQLESAEALAINNGINRALYEHAIAVLIGKPPSCFSIPPQVLSAIPPLIPAALPCALLQRRPDIAQAERLMAQANAEIGVAISAFFPTLTLSATGTSSGISSIGNWLSMPVLGWAVGPQLAALILDGGFRSAAVAAARATYRGTVATYRQTVLAAFQDVEDNLATLRILQAQSIAQHKAANDARLALTLVMNQYQAGTVAYSNVLTAQIAAFTAEKSAYDVDYLRMTAAVGLIKALGGGWAV